MTDCRQGKPTETKQMVDGRNVHIPLHISLFCNLQRCMLSNSLKRGSWKDSKQDDSIDESLVCPMKCDCNSPSLG